MDLAIVVILIIVVILVFKDIKWVTYLLGIVEIFLRIVHWIGDNLQVPDLNRFINNYLPDSLFSMIGQYVSGTLEIILDWILLGFFIFFLIYLVRYFFNKKH